VRKIERALLIFPPVTSSPQSMKQCQVPLGVAYLAAVLRDACEVKVLDAAVEGYHHEEKTGPGNFRYGLPFAEIEKRIAEVQPDLVGISCISSSQFQNVLEICRSAKRVDREILTITGGSHPTFLPESSLAHPELDLVARGEGEFTLRELVTASRQGRGPEGIAGLAYRRNGQVLVAPDRTPAPLDEIPFPARDLFPLEKYFFSSLPMGSVYKRKPFINLITSRGCPYRCTFCSSTTFWGNAYRTRSVENVLEEMDYLVNKLGVREFKFFDDNLTADQARAREIFQGMIARRFNVTWNTPNGIHVTHLDDELLDLMKASGCYELTLAVESGDPDVLRNIIHKPTKLAEVEAAAKLMRKKGIGSHGFFIIGFPGETREQIQRTLDFSRQLDLDRISCFTANPLPGTELYRICKEKGYISDDYSFDLIDYLEGRLDTPEWSREELHRLRRRWFWRYNLSLILRHPLGFFRRYLPLLTRPGLLLEIISRILRG
jgi:anaerobic magnesium-protoporphyrin IX monomethyl ester cyclase